MAELWSVKHGKEMVQMCVYAQIVHKSIHWKKNKSETVMIVVDKDMVEYYMSWKLIV